MNQAALVLRLVALDRRWLILLGTFVFLAATVILVIWRLLPHDPVLIDFLLFSWLCLPYFLDLTHVGQPYQLGLPISTRTLFAVAFLLFSFSVWLPVLSVAAFFRAIGQADAIPVPLGAGALAMLGFCAIRLAWPSRQTAPRTAGVAVCAVLLIIGIAWLSHPPSLATVAMLLAACAAACLLILRRLPPVLADAEFVRDRGVSSAGATHPWLVLARILMGQRVFWFFLVLSDQWRNWAYAGFWIALFCSTFRTNDPLLLALPLSQLRLLYARLACSCLLAGIACYIDLMGRLLRHHSEPTIVSFLLAVCVGLALTAAASLPRWRPLRNLPRWPLALIPVVFFFGTLAFAFTPSAQDIAAIAPQKIVSWLIGAIVLLLWLITVQTRESDCILVPNVKQ